MKNDAEFNIVFVQLVEKYPQLYNYTLEAYSNKHEVDKTWREIGDTVKETGAACMEKWRTLRGGFNRYLKSKPASGSGIETKKPYYLAKYMEFLIPYLKSRSQKGNFHTLENYEVQDTPDVGFDDNVSVPQVEILTQYVLTSESLETPETPHSSDREFQRSRKRKVVDPFDSAVVEYIQAKKIKAEDEAACSSDLHFFLKFIARGGKIE